jgi:hypothetical protein
MAMRAAVCFERRNAAFASESACPAAEHAAKTSGAIIRMSILFESHTGLLNGAAGIVENGTSSWPKGDSAGSMLAACVGHAEHPSH